MKTSKSKKEVAVQAEEKSNNANEILHEIQEILEHFGRKPNPNQIQSLSMKQEGNRLSTKQEGNRVGRRNAINLIGSTSNEHFVLRQSILWRPLHQRRSSLSLVSAAAPASWMDWINQGFQDFSGMRSSMLTPSVSQLQQKAMFHFRKWRYDDDDDESEDGVEEIMLQEEDDIRCTVQEFLKEQDRLNLLRFTNNVSVTKKEKG